MWLLGPQFTQHQAGPPRSAMGCSLCFCAAWDLQCTTLQHRKPSFSLISTPPRNIHHLQTAGKEMGSSFCHSPYDLIQP